MFEPDFPILGGVLTSFIWLFPALQRVGYQGDWERCRFWVGKIANKLVGYKQLGKAFQNPVSPQQQVNHIITIYAKHSPNKSLLTSALKGLQSMSLPRKSITQNTLIIQISCANHQLPLSNSCKVSLINFRSRDIKHIRLNQTSNNLINQFKVINFRSQTLNNKFLQQSSTSNWYKVSPINFRS